MDGLSVAVESAMGVLIVYRPVALTECAEAKASSKPCARLGHCRTSWSGDCVFADRATNVRCRESIEGQLQRLGVDCIDLWVLRGFVESETSVEETMAGVKVCPHPP